MKRTLFFFLSWFPLVIAAQKDSTSTFSFGGYGEMYYSYDFANPPLHEKEDFLYNHKRHNEINANMVLVSAHFDDKKQRANLGLMAGNYAHYNLSSEPVWAQFIYEANLGIKLSKKKNIWVDAGIMPSHIGFESAISADCWTLTRSILAENSPYYETGIKLSYAHKKGNLYVAFLLLNGWQHIQKPPHLQWPSAGLQINYKPSENLTINYSNFVGTDSADSLHSLRVFHNIYLQAEPLKRWGFMAGFDLGTDKRDAQNYGLWLSPVIIMKYKISNKWRMAIRGEYYDDRDQIIVSTDLEHGFQIAGFSANLDYFVTKNMTWRVEGKIYEASDEVFYNKHKNNYSFTTNFTVRL